MSIDLFRVMNGLDIQLDDLSKNANVLVGDGLPGGDSGQQDAAPLGTVFLRTNAGSDGLQFYWKFSTTNNSFADWKTGASKEYVDAAVAGLSWREPVVVRDNTLYANAAAFPVSGIVDGVPLNPGDRVLFTNVTTGTDENIFIWNGGSPATWTEDTNVETDGDAVLVQQGTSTDQQFVYDGTNWILFGSAVGVAELGYIRTFIGKTGPGPELPTYTGLNTFVQGTNLEQAIDKVDIALGTGNITNTGGNWPISADAAFTGTNGVNGTLTITTILDELNAAVGNATFTNSGINITNGDSTNTSINNLNNALITIQNGELVISGSQPAATLTTMDTLPVADATEVKWLVQVRSTGTPANRRAVEVHAITDGTLVDHTEYAVIKLGATIPALNINVGISGANMILTVNSTSGVDYVVKRIGYTAF